jgi:hypothetical protein
MGEVAAHPAALDEGIGRGLGDARVSVAERTRDCTKSQIADMQIYLHA